MLSSMSQSLMQSKMCSANDVVDRMCLYKLGHGDLLNGGFIVQMLQSTDFTQSMHRDWRNGDFGCGRCGKPLTGQRYIMREEQPYCKQCYDTEFANTCGSCGTAITTDYKVISLSQ
jgi:LIM domain